MSKTLRTRSLCLGLAFAAAALLAISLNLPLWHLRMEAPQYREEEALKVAVYPHALRGDLNEIRTLNKYIGVHVPTQLPQFRWLPGALIAAGSLGLAVAFLPARARRAGLVIVPVLLTLALSGAAIQAQRQMFEIGHKRDAKPELVGVRDFTPPLLGKTKVAQFEVECGFGIGAYLIVAAVVMQLLGAWSSRERRPVWPNSSRMAEHPHAADWESARSDVIQESR